MRKLLIFLVLFYSLLTAQEIRNKQIKDIIDPTFQFSVNVINGWNMLSIPGNHPYGNNVDNWWPNRNPLAVVYDWSCQCAVTTASPAKGYWVQTGAQTLVWSGIIIVPHNPIPITPGWNMIGVYEDTVAVSDLVTTPPGIIVPGTILGWNGSYYNAIYLYPGYSYWLLSTAYGVINIAKNNSVVKENGYENNGKVIFTDASGKSFTLYSLNGSADDIKYLMPPPPPEGCFDVRYSSGRRAENLESGEQGIDLSGVKYPVTVTTDNVTIRVRDILSRQLDAILKPGESVSISDINKLFVSSEIVPAEYSLGQNYPNPFNPSTQIEYTIPKAGLVTLSVYNSIGEEVSQLVNEVQEPGKYKIQFNAAELPSGVYLYKITSGDFVQTRKMLLLK